jgi:signal transduction histidine kinase/DNA-binding response OmpR family regulator
MGSIVSGRALTADVLFDGTDPTQAVLRATDWDLTALGPVEGWPGELHAAVRTVLPSRVPMLLWWGPQLTQLYNDAFRPLIGDKHPRAVGQDAADCYPEAWAELGPLAENVLRGAGATYSRDLRLPYERHGYVEETYWTFSYSPVRVDHSVGGVFIACLDTTSRVLAERRLHTLHELGSVSTAEARTTAGACRASLDVLAENRRDVPFALSYALDEADASLRVVASLGVAERTVPRWRGESLEAASRNVMTSHRPEVVNGIGAELAPVFEPAEPGASPATAVDRAYVLPLIDQAGERAVGTLALGISPQRAFDDDYRQFFELVGRHVSAAVTDVLAYLAEHMRAEALEAVDRAKTRFLQNVSHEFRTPLTLVLGPLSELLGEKGSDLAPGGRMVLDAARRAALRLEWLVDSLLEFARGDGEAEAGPGAAEATDVGALTAECAAMFRPAVERAGLSLVLDVHDDAAVGLVALNGEAWVKVLSNLLSNAVKFTTSGTITVRVRRADVRLVLEVVDTGAGIPAPEVPRIFDRFYRAPGAPAHTNHGLGIGLSLVAELVDAMRGSIDVTSTPGRGSTFTVVVPAPAADGPGRDRLPATAHARAAAADTASWVGSAAETQREARETRSGAGRVLLVEDNADMRAYLTHLLHGDGWGVDAVVDAEAALQAADAGHDLVLCDVMLPGMDGLELVRALRQAPSTARLPIVVLTARAGPESAAEGLEAGADDYIVKPFEPVELLARTRVHIELSRLRAYALDQAERRAANLEVALTTNRQIGAAIGILMHQRKITESQGFELLRQVSQHTNRKLRDIADEVLFTGALPPDATGIAF